MSGFQLAEEVAAAAVKVSFFSDASIGTCDEDGAEVLRLRADEGIEVSESFPGGFWCSASEGAAFMVVSGCSTVPCASLGAQSLHRKPFFCWL